jgi:DNA-binding SARP family transcriptional activator
MAQLSLRLLGGFLLRADGRPRPLPARKAQALLAYLAVRGGRAHARDALTGLLWADAGERQARQSLRQTMVRLRRALAGSPRALVTQGDTVTLGAIDVDVAAFERLVRRGTPEALESAVALYEGPLLDGVHVAAPGFEEWLESERARLAELALDAHRRLVDRHLKRGRIEAATQAATRLLTLDPVQEEAHRTLMRLHVRQGRRSAALRQYQSCVAVLQKELGVEPEPSTKRLYLEILQRSARPVATGAAGRSAPLAADAPIVGREAEVARLRQRLQSAWRGEGQVVLVTGEAGIGKSRLIDEVSALAIARGTRVLLSRAHETEQILPFRPWVDALRAGHALTAMRAESAASSPRRAELARLFPELGGGGAAPPITGAGHLRLFESLDTLLGELAAEGPLLVVLEDLHWADEMSLRLFAFVARRLVGRPILLVASAREEDLAAALSLNRLVDELNALPHMDHVALGALSASATATLVRALARAGSNAARLAEAVDHVWALSEGNPFVIVETMRALREGRVPEAPGVELPRRVREMIAARLGRLSARAQEVARVASVFTRDFEFPVLQRAMGLSRRETAEAVEELVRHRVLDTPGERFDFTHVRIRQAVYAGLLGPRRQALHAAIGEALEAVYAGHLAEHYDRLAYHFSRADEPARAVTYLIHLADKVARSYALDEAVRLLKDALAATDRLPPDARSGPRLDVVYRLTHVLAMLGRPTEARDLLLGHESLVASLGQPTLSGTLHFWLAYIYGNLSDSVAAIGHARRALEEAARGGDDVTMGKASYALSRESYMTGNPRDGITQGRQAVALLERSEERSWLGSALGILAFHLLHVGDFEPALEILDRMRGLGEDLHEVRLQAEAAWTTARVHTVTGDVEAAIAAARRAVELAADPVGKAGSLAWLGAAHLEGGDAKQAIELLDDSTGRLQRLSAAGGYRYRQVDGMVRALLAEAHLDAGHVDQARAIATEALAIAREGGWPVAIGYAERALGRVDVAAGRLNDGEAALERALHTFAAAEARAQVARTRVALGRARAARGDVHAAAADLRAAHVLFGQMRTPRLVERVRQLADDLGVSLGATMLVCREALPNVAGEQCQALLLQAHYYRGQLVNEANVLFLRLAAGWHRIFIESGVVFWHTVDAPDTNSAASAADDSNPDGDRHHYTVTDLGAAHGLIGRRLADVTTVDLASGGELRLLFAGGACVTFRHVEGRSSVAVGGAPSA